MEVCVRLHLLLLSLKYCGALSLQFGQGLDLPYLFKHLSQNSLPHSTCCCGASATSRQIKHFRASLGSRS